MFVKVLGLLVFLAACTPMQISAPFSPREVAYITQKGRAAISGQAFLRQQGGGIVTCAGSNALLVPAGQYATELFSKAFGARAGGVAGALTMGPKNTPVGFRTALRKSRCDAGGNFAFPGVADGDYYVVAKVSWRVGNTIIPEGGVVGRRIRVIGGRSQRVIVSG